MNPNRTYARLGIAALALACFTAPAAADFEAGMSYLKSGKYLEAAGEFQTVVDESPDYAYGYALLGVCFLKTGKNADAEKNFLKAIELDGNQFEFHYNLANVYRVQGKHDKVVKTLNNAESLAPDDKKALVWQVRGNALYAQSKWGEAIADLEQLSRAKPSPETHSQLGKAYFKVGENEAAVRELKKAVKSDPSTNNYETLIEAMLNVAAKTTGGEAAKKAKYAEALTQAEAFLKAQPSFTAKNLVGSAALGAGQFDRAVSAFQAALKDKPNYCNAMVNMGKAYTAKADWAKAVQILESATQCDASMGLAWESMGFVLQKSASGSKEYATQQRYYDKAIAAYKKAAAIKPSASITKAIQTCEQNREISRQNQGVDQAEAEQAAAIAAEKERLAEEERKRKEWAAKQKAD